MAANEVVFQYGEPLMVDYTPSGTLPAGQVTVVNSIPMIPHTYLEDARLGALAAGGGVYRCVGDAAISSGKIVYWDDTNNKVTETATGNTIFGFTVSACSGDAAYCNVVHAPLSASSLIPSLTVKDLLTLEAANVAAAGSAQGDATALSGAILYNETAADGTKGVVLPASPTAGTVILVYTTVAANGLKIYPASGGAINGGSANAAITVEGKTLTILVATSTTNWAAMYTANT